MKVLVAQKRGFCFGVEDAIEMAENTVDKKNPGTVYSLGPVIHNNQVVDRLKSDGLCVVDGMDEVDSGTVLIRSHGVPPGVVDDLKERGLDVVDATCVLVTRAQNIVKQLHEEGYRVVMIGDANHPEVKGVIGYAPNVIVVDCPEDLDKLPKRGKLGVVAQTTHTPEHVGKMVGLIAARPYRELKVVNTLCLEVVRRQEAAVALCKEVEVMFVLGGLHSANTKELAELCRHQGVPTHHLETWDQFDSEMAEEKEVAGVAAGASTPEWIIQDFVKRLEEFETVPVASTG